MNCRTLDFARQELCEYWEKTTGCKQNDIELLVDPDSDYWKEKIECEMDDAYHIDVTAGYGCIVGSNERSVLLGVYGFFTALGCCFHTPGPAGEYVVTRSVAECTVQKTAIASLRHRGICIEGAVSIENVLDMIDWLPKNGFNSYFVQFREGYNFFDRWYSHLGNTCLQAEPFDIEKSHQFVALVCWNPLNRMVSGCRRHYCGNHTSTFGTSEWMPEILWGYPAEYKFVLFTPGGSAKIRQRSGAVRNR